MVALLALELMHRANQLSRNFAIVPTRKKKGGYELVDSCMLSHFSRVHLFVTVWTVAHQAPLSMESSRQEYWSELACPPPGYPPDLGIEPASPALAVGIPWRRARLPTPVFLGFPGDGKESACNAETGV